MKGIGRIVACLGCAVLVLGSWGCTGPGVVIPSGDEEGASSCRGMRDEIEQTRTAVGGRFETAMVEMGGAVEVERLKEVRGHFDGIQRDYQLKTEALCGDLERGAIDAVAYGRRRYCLDQQLTAMRVLDRLLAGASSAQDPQHFVWLLESRIDWLEQTTVCLENAEARPEVFDGLEDATRGGRQVAGAPTPQPAGCRTSSRGFYNGGTLTLEPQEGGGFCQELKVEVELVCKRKVGPDRFEDVVGCNGANLKEYDRFKVRFKANRPVYIYFNLSNSTGQYQMFFPRPQDDNRFEAGVLGQAPVEGDWIELDEMAGVLEQLQVVASVHPIRELEDERGLDIPPQPGGRFDRKASRTRGKMEPSATRGGGGQVEGGETGSAKMEPSATRGGRYKGASEAIDNKGQEGTRPDRIVAEDFDVVTVEFVIRHVK